MNNKVLVKLYVPTMEIEYDIWLPVNKTIYNVTVLLIKAINDFSGGYYMPKNLPHLYNKDYNVPYPYNKKIKETNIRNGTQLVLI